MSPDPRNLTRKGSSARTADERARIIEQREGLIGIEDAARYLSVKVSWLYEMVRLGRVPSYRVGKFRRFRVSELEAWLTARRYGPGAQKEAQPS